MCTRLSRKLTVEPRLESRTAPPREAFADLSTLGFQGFPSLMLGGSCSLLHTVPSPTARQPESTENPGLISLCHSLPSVEKKEHFSPSKDEGVLLEMTFWLALYGSAHLSCLTVTLSEPPLQPVLAILFAQLLF